MKPSMMDFFDHGKHGKHGTGMMKWNQDDEAFLPRIYTNFHELVHDETWHYET